MSPFRRARRTRRAALGAATAAVAAACATTPYRGITEAADAPSITSTSAPTDVLGTTTVRPAPTTSTAPAPAPPTTSTAAAPAPPTTSTAPAPAPPTTVVAPTTVAPGPVTPVRAGWHLETITTGVRVEVPDSWTVETPVPTSAAARALLPGLAPQLDAAGVFATTPFVATDRGAGRTPAPSVVVTEVPRASEATAISTLATLRSLVGNAVAASTPAPQSSPLGDGAYITYQPPVGADGRTTVSEHYAFVRGDTVLLVMMTTTVDRAATDGRVFGHMLATLAPVR